MLKAPRGAFWYDDGMKTFTAEEIAALYDKKLVLPSIKPSPQFYLVPVGLVGAGKTTVLKPLSSHLNLLRISGDEIRKIIKEIDGPLDKAWEVGRFLVEKYTKQGYSIAHDTDGATPRTQAAIKESSARYKIKVIWIYINPPEQFILNKLRSTKPDFLYESVDEAVADYFRRKPMHEDLNIDFTYEFDTSKPNLEVQIGEAIRAIQLKLQNG